MNRSKLNQQYNQRMQEYNNGKQLRFNKEFTLQLLHMRKKIYNFAENPDDILKRTQWSRQDLFQNPLFAILLDE